MRLAMRRLSLIPAEALSVTFLPSPGPGGQNVNKVETAVRLSLDLARAELPDAMRLRLVRLAGRRVSQAGVLSITASRHRTQEANRRDAAHPPRPRKATKPTRASAERRLTAKAHRGRAKATRGRPPPD